MSALGTKPTTSALQRFRLLSGLCQRHTPVTPNLMQSLRLMTCKEMAAAKATQAFCKTKTSR